MARRFLFALVICRPEIAEALDDFLYACEQMVINAVDINRRLYD